MARNRRYAPLAPARGAVEAAVRLPAVDLAAPAAGRMTGQLVFSDGGYSLV